MTIRRPLFAAAALIAASVALPALADDFQTGGIPLVGATTTNTTVGTNVAAGIGNNAFQNMGVSQKGGKAGLPGIGIGLGLGQQLGGAGLAQGLPSTTSNSINGTNVAAGTGNNAFQGLGVAQAGASHGTVSNGLDGLNLAAGQFNNAGQVINSRQR